MSVRIVAALSIILLLTAAAGCGGDKSTTSPRSSFRDLAQKEDVIYNLSKSYEKTNAGRYEELLGDTFAWYYVDKPSSGFFLKDVDVQITKNVFLATKGLYNPEIQSLYLSISQGVWQEVDSIAGEACDNCWKTSRRYSIEFVIGEYTQVATGIILCVIVGKEEGGEVKYRLLTVHDLGGLSDEFDLIRSRIELPSWSSIKLISLPS